MPCKMMKRGEKKDRRKKKEGKQVEIYTSHINGFLHWELTSFPKYLYVTENFLFDMESKCAEAEMAALWLSSAAAGTAKNNSKEQHV